MVKFKIKTKGKINQGFNENKNPLYKEAGYSGHTGVDWAKGYGTPVTTDNAGIAYKVADPIKGTVGPSGFGGVYLLSHIGKDKYMEIVLGHLSRIYISEGDYVPENYVVGNEGNTGDVYQGGVYYPEGAPNKGTKGSHVHEQYRPVTRVKQMTANKHYLNNRDGSVYTDNAGYYYEIDNTNNVRGCVDPMLYVYVDTVEDIKRNISNVVKYILERFKTPSKTPKNEL